MTDMDMENQDDYLTIAYMLGLHDGKKQASANIHCADQSGSEIRDEDWPQAFKDYEAACGGFGDKREIMMQAFSYGWDMRTHKHSFQNSEKGRTNDE